MTDAISVSVSENEYTVSGAAAEYVIRIQFNDRGYPVGKLADVTLQFTAGDLAGLKLLGFAVWKARSGDRNVVMPSRTYSVNGERRSFALLRPWTTEPIDPRGHLSRLILDAVARCEAAIAAGA